MSGSTQKNLETLRDLRSKSLLGGGQKRIDQQHEKGKLTARERIAMLVDEGSFQELGALATHDLDTYGMDKQRFAGDGVVTGLAKVHGRRVALYAQDFTVMGGSFSAIQAQKINRVQDIALATGIPVIGLNDSGGARIQEGSTYSSARALCSARCRAYSMEAGEKSTPTQACPASASAWV